MSWIRRAMQYNYFPICIGASGASRVSSCMSHKRNISNVILLTLQGSAVLTPLYCCCGAAIAELRSQAPRVVFVGQSCEAAAAAAESCGIITRNTLSPSEGQAKLIPDIRPDQSGVSCSEFPDSVMFDKAEGERMELNYGSGELSIRHGKCINGQEFSASKEK